MFVYFIDFDFEGKSRFIMTNHGKYAIEIMEAIYKTYDFETLKEGELDNFNLQLFGEVDRDDSQFSPLESLEVFEIGIEKPGSYWDRTPIAWTDALETADMIYKALSQKYKDEKLYILRTERIDDEEKS